MRKIEEIKEAYDDELFGVMMDKLAGSLGAAYREEMKRLEDDPDAAVPERLDAKCLKMIKKQVPRRNRKRISVWTVVQRAAAVILIISAMMTVAVAAVPEVKTWFMNTFIQPFEDHTDFSFSTGNAIPRDLLITPIWIPEGYSLFEEESTEISVYKAYQKNETDYICIYKLLAAEQNYAFDTEAADIESIIVQGYSATLAIKEGEAWVLIPISDQNYIVWICMYGEISETDLVKIAENLPLT